MKARRIFSLCLVLILALSLLTACGDTGSKDNNPPAGSSDAQEIPDSIKPTSKKIVVWMKGDTEEFQKYYDGFWRIIRTMSWTSRCLPLPTMCS